MYRFYLIRAAHGRIRARDGASAKVVGVLMTQMQTCTRNTTGTYRSASGLQDRAASVHKLWQFTQSSARMRLTFPIGRGFPSSEIAVCKTM